MEDIINLIATDASPSDISTSIKNALYAKASERVDSARPLVASTVFGEIDVEEETAEDQE